MFEIAVSGECFMPPKGVFPTKENCDPNDPEEVFLWLFAAMPGVKGAPFIMPIEYYRNVSKFLWEQGLRHVEPQMWEYCPPEASSPSVWTSAGKWVPVGTVTEEQKELAEARAGLGRMGHAQKVEFYKALKASVAGEPLPPTKAGDVVSHMTARQRNLFLGLLNDSA
jgi:hypothetical protein